MTYDTVANVSSLLGLLFFLLLFAGILFWAFRPKNRRKFDEAARIPLEPPELADLETKNQKP
jgi:cytochrome c oxidase cbb3-type subunit 4